MQKHRALHFVPTTKVTLQSNVAARPTLPTDLVSIAAVGNIEGGKAAWGIIQITRQSGSPVLAGPVIVKGMCDGEVVQVGVLNGGAAISPLANDGYQEFVLGVGLCDSLVIDPVGGISGGNFNAYYRPVSERLG